MPDELAWRVRQAWDAGIATPERLCFTLLSQVWREIELDFMLACSPRTGSVISGGVDWRSRAERQAEAEVARAAVMIGMLHRRLDTKDGAGATDGQARVLEDNRVGVSWHVLPEFGAVRFSGLRAEAAPWQEEHAEGRHWCNTGDSLTVLPRPRFDAQVADAVLLLGNEAPVAVVVPADADGDAVAVGAVGALLLRCPDRLGELDQAVESKLLSARISRS